MTRLPNNRVRLGRADWGGLLSFALALLSVAGATLYKVNEVAQTNRERLARLDAEIVAVRRSVGLLQADVREIARRPRP